MVRRPKNSSPNIAVNIGTAPFSSPVTAELMCCSASGKSVNGMPTQMTDSATIGNAVLGHAGASAIPAAAPRVTAPRPTRSDVMTPGSRLSNPMAMKRNDAPQMSPMDVKIDQSREREGGRRWSARPAGWRGRRTVTAASLHGAARGLAAGYAAGSRSAVSSEGDRGRGAGRRQRPGRRGAGPRPRTTAPAPRASTVSRSAVAELLGEHALHLGAHPAPRPRRASPAPPATRGRSAAQPGGPARSTRRAGR